MSTEKGPLGLATWRSLLTLTEQLGRTGDGGGWGSLMEKVRREQVNTLPRSFAEREGGSWAQPMKEVEMILTWEKYTSV